MDDALYIIIPAYNEEENIRSCIKQWYPVIEKHNSTGNSKIIVINDGSKDHTEEILRSMIKDLPLLTYVTKPNGGHGSSVLYGYKKAIQENAGFVFQTDSDGQTDPAEFETFWKKRNECTGIFGNRKTRQDGFQRKCVEKTVCILLRLIFHVRVPDANAPFRLMKTEILAKYIDVIPENFNIPNIILTACFAKYEPDTLFLPVSFKPRTKGKNSINIKKIIKIGMHAVPDMVEIKNRLAKMFDK